jgi:hypothetical protein
MTDCKTFCVILIEDNRDHARLVQAALALSDARPRVTWFDDASQAERFIRDTLDNPEARTDLVLLDLKMPHLDGHELLRRLKNHPAARHIPVVVLSTSSALGDIERAYAFHANGYLVKPIHFPDMARMMQGVVRFWGPG